MHGPTFQLKPGEVRSIQQSLYVILRSCPFIDGYKIGSFLGQLPLAIANFHPLKKGTGLRRIDLRGDWHQFRQVAKYVNLGLRLTYDVWLNCGLALPDLVKVEQFQLSTSHAIMSFYDHNAQNHIHLARVGEL